MIFSSDLFCTLIWFLLPCLGVKSMKLSFSEIMSVEVSNLDVIPLFLVFKRTPKIHFKGSNPSYSWLGVFLQRFFNTLNWSDDRYYIFRDNLDGLINHINVSIFTLFMALISW